MSAPAMAVSAGLNAFGSLAKGRSDANAANYNAGLNDLNAGIALQQGESDAVQAGRLNFMRLSAARAAYGASGVTSEGSPLDVLESVASQGELDVQNIRYKAKLKSLGYSTSAGLDRMRADTAETQALFGAAASSLRGGAYAASMGGGTRGAGTPINLGGYSGYTEGG